MRKPAELIVVVARVNLPERPEVRSGLALSLLIRAGSISVARPAQVAGFALPSFLEILASLKIHDAGPLIDHAQIGHLDLLHQVFGAVVLTSKVELSRPEIATRLNKISNRWVDDSEKLYY